MEQILQYYKDQMNSEERSSSYLESSNDLFGFNCSDIPLDRYEELFQKFQGEKGRSNNVIEAFDNWLEERLPLQIKNQKIEDKDKGIIIYFDNVRIYKPYMVGVSPDGETFEGLPDKTGIVPMFPRDAMVRQSTYSSEIKVDIYSKKITGDSTFERQLQKADVPLGRVPIIKGCKYCWLRGMTDEEKVAAGECFNDPLGYFIVGGSEKVIIAKESNRVGQMMISKWDSKKSTNGIRIYSLITKSSILISLNVDHKNNNMIEVVFNSKPPSPVFLLSLLLQYLYDEDLIRRSTDLDSMLSTCRDVLQYIIEPEVLSFVEPGEIDRVKARLLSTITKTLSVVETDAISLTDASDDSTVLDPIAVFAKTLDRSASDKKTSKISFASIVDEIRMNVFPITSDDSLEGATVNDFDRRRQMLSKMVAVYARYLEGYRPEDDRDSYMIRRIDTVGRQMETAFNYFLTNTLRDFKTSTLTINSDNFSNKFESRIRSGIKNGLKRENFSDVLERITPAAIYSQLRRVSIPGDSKSFTENVRVIKPSQVGYICTGETPDGKGCGVLRNLTSLCWISIPRFTDDIEEVIEPYISSERESSDQVHVLLDGNILGFIAESEYINLKKAVKRDLRTYDVPVAFNTIDNQVDIFSTGSIPTRPLLTINPETGRIFMEELDDESLRQMSIDELTEAGYLEYNAPFELDSRYPTNPEVDTFWKDLNKGYTYIKIAEYTQDVEDLLEDHSRGKRLDEQPYTHAEIVPHFQFGYSASCVPKGNHNKGPRVTYQSSMFKQAISGFHSNHVLRYDSGFKLHQFPTRTMFETSTHKPIGINTMPTTATAVIAMYTRAKNNEDALVGKTEFFDNNLRYIYYSTNTINIRDNEKIDVRPENESDPKLHAIYKASDGVSENMIGFPKLGSFIKKGDAILSKYIVTMDTATSTTKFVKNYTTLGVWKEGYVVGVEVIRTRQSYKVVRIKIAQYRRQIIGDKVASRYSQKGTFGEHVPERDLPRIVGGDNDGVVPDLLFNPHSIPSRLTQGKILEILATKAALYTGRRINASSFSDYKNDDYMKQYERVLIDNGMEPSGLETMRHPDGSLVEVKIFVGACSYQVLRHHVADKFQVRDSGTYEPLTHQPVRGRFKEGGLRAGEMERDAMISHGNSRVVLDRMMNSSDLYRIVVCKKCGNIAESNFDPRETSCPVCPDSRDFGVMNIPYVSHLIIRMLNAAGIHIHFRF